jgi:hypothetical protein
VGNYDILSRKNHPLLTAMAGTLQDVEFHQEGDVLVHTKIVLEELERLDIFKQLTEDSKIILRLAAFFHDTGKPFTTKDEEGHLRSMGHARKGEILTRILLQGLIDYSTREIIATLVRQHTCVPFYLNTDSPEDGCVRLSFLTDTRLLYVLCLADAAGRKGRDTEYEDTVKLFKETCQELDCYGIPYSFGCNNPPEYFMDSEPYDDLYAEARYLLMNREKSYKDVIYLAEDHARRKSYFDVFIMCGMAWFR